MTQIARCHYQEYVQKDVPSWLDHLLFPVAETWGMPGYREEKSFTLTIPYPELLLIHKHRFFAAGSLVQREQPVEFEIAKWSFRFETFNGSELDLMVREVKRTPLQTWFSNLSQGWQYGLAIASVVLPGAILWFGISALMHYPDPGWFWIWFGQHVRRIVGWGLFFLLLISDLWSIFRYSKSPFIQNVLLFLLSFSALVVPIVWLIISSPPPPPAATPEECIQYVYFLKTKATTMILLLAGIVPWLTLLLKWLGLDLLASIIGLGVDRLKPKISA